MLELTLPQYLPEISCIEVPGTIEGTGRTVVEALGGLEALSKCLGRNVEVSNVSGCTAKGIQSGIFLRCNSRDRYSSFLSSTVQRRSDILIRYKRNRVTGDLIDVEPIGLIAEKVTFDLMADFYCIPPEGPRTTEFDVRSELDERCTDPLFIPPPVFTRIVTPFHYNFEDNPLCPNRSEMELTRKRHVLKDSDSPYSEARTPVDVVSKQQQQQQPDVTQNAVQKSSSEQPQQAISTEESVTDYAEELSAQCSEGEVWESATVMDKDKQYNADVLPDALPCTRNIARRHRGKTDETANAVWRYSCSRVPSSPPAGALTLPADPELVTIYSALFESRPIWLRSLLELHLPTSVSPWKRKPVFGRSCYLCIDGPWRGAYCRMGYDPRQDPESRRYQTIDFRDPYFRSVTWKLHPESRTLSDTKSFKKNRSNTASLISSMPNILETEQIAYAQGWRGDAAKTTVEIDDDLHFRTPPSRPSQLYQLCDIDDNCVQQLLANTPPLDTCCKASGWLPRSVLIKIRDLMLLASKRMRPQQDARLPSATE